MHKTDRKYGIYIKQVGSACPVVKDASNISFTFRIRRAFRATLPIRNECIFAVDAFAFNLIADQTSVDASAYSTWIRLEYLPVRKCSAIVFA